MNGYWEHRRSDAQLELIQPIAHHLPDFTIAFGLKDEPQFMFDHEVRDKLLDLGAKGKSTSSSFFTHGPIARAFTLVVQLIHVRLSPSTRA